MDYSTTHHVPSLKDVELLDRAQAAFALATEIPGTQGGNLTVDVAGERHQFKPDDAEAIQNLRSGLAGVDGRYISSITISVRVPGAKSQNPGNIAFTVTRNNPNPVANLKVSTNNVGTSTVALLPALEAVVAKFEPIDPVESKVEFATDDATQYLRALDEKLQQLSNVAIEQTERVTESLRTQALRNEDVLREHREKLEEEYARRHAELDKQREVLEERIKDVDLADAKTSRRRLREQLKQKLDELAAELKFTAQTNRDRFVLYGVLGLALFVGAFVIIEATLALRDPTVMESDGWIYLALRAGLGSALFGGVLIYFIRWQSAWVRERTREELRLLRTSLDVERASWVVESLVEFKNEEIDQMPEALLAAVTRNLFADPGQSAEITTPIDDVAEILRSGAQTVKLKLGEHEVTLDRRALKGLSATSKAGS